ncbi:MAG TPA: hypothetical protein VGR95_18785 [Thermoanaerobaculia bacterium]|nr:hypothetical protein [Thermoanaerobaculia bacterium]
MIRRTLFLIAAVFVLAVPLSAQYLVTVQTYHSVSGSDWAALGPYMSVKLHNVSTGANYPGYTDASGIATISAAAGTYQVYVWDPSYNYYWGSIDTPQPGTYTVYATPYTQVLKFSAFPRPYAPNLVSPCNYCAVGPGNFDLVWTNGLDAARTASNWPVTYEIWDSTTLPGDPQQPEWLAVSDAPCNPDASGNCHFHVDSGLGYCPGCQYTWRIVVKINFGGGFIYKTSGPSWHLHQP